MGHVNEAFFGNAKVLLCYPGLYYYYYISSNRIFALVDREAVLALLIF